MKPALSVGVLLVLVANVVPAGAQMPPADPSLTWYVHNVTSTSGGSGPTLSFTAPGSDEVAVAASCTTACAGAAALVHHADAETGLPVALVATGTGGEAHVWVKSYQGGAAPGTKATVTVFADGVSIATGTATMDVVAATVEYVITLDFKAASIAMGAKISMELAVQDSHCTCYLPVAYAKGVDATYAWRFTLPVTVSGATTSGANHYASESGPSLHATLALPTATTANYFYNWTTGFSAVEISYSAQPTAGSVHFLVLDADNKTLLDKALSAAEDRSVQVPAATAGVWHVSIQLTGFQGNATLVIVSSQLTPPSSSPPGGSSGPGPTDGGNPGTPSGGSNPSPSQTSKGSPGIDAVLFAAVLAGSVLVARRRQA
ncbi:MAG: hypothetical protein V4510_00355 [bacterium]